MNTPGIPSSKKPAKKARKHPYNHVIFQAARRIPSTPGVATGLVEQARQHEIRRENCVADVLAHLYAMTAGGILSRKSPTRITVSRAAFQTVKASGVNQAAHLLPGQIRINGQLPADYIHAQAAAGAHLLDVAVALRLNSTFGLTEVLHRNFNYVDSRLERNGMVAAFESAAQFVVGKGLSSGGRKIDPSIVRRGYEIFVQGSAPAFEVTLQRLQTKVTDNLDREASREQLGIAETERDVAGRIVPEALHPTQIMMLEGAYDTQENAGQRG